jgi:hypothetical protein
MRRAFRWFGVFLWTAAGWPWAALPDHAEYTQQVLQYTTESAFLTDWVRTTPKSDTVPSPLEVLGYVPGTPGRLTYAADVHRYFRVLEKASPRVRVFSLGMTEEGREMILAVIADEAAMARLDRYREITNRLADPRGLSEAEAEALIAEGRPMYWLLGGLHSPETGSPEMLMELAYRLVVSDDPRIEAIRRNVIVLITPVQEVDGRERIVDIMRYRAAHPGKPAPPLVYWGHYVAHDNNRDAIGLGLALTRNLLRGFLTWKPQVLHDLHESIPFLYISGGTGPFNAWLDPIVIDEWRAMAWYEVEQLTRQGVPGVWTHGFWDGWAPNYVMSIAMFRNAIGRFYETFGNSVPDTMDRIVRGQTRREWYRPNPPTPTVRWSLRNNINLQESGVLTGLYYVATHAKDFLRNFYVKSLRSVAKARTEGPAAYVLPTPDARPTLQARLLRLLQDHAVEVHRLTEAARVREGEFSAGSWVIRMDQPYSRLADTLLDQQYYNPNDPSPYDDTGWTLGALFHTKTVRVTDPAILEASMELVREPVPPPARLEGAGPIFLVRPTGEPEVALLPFRLKGIPMEALTAAWSSDVGEFPAGTLVLDGRRQADRIEAVLRELGLRAVRTDRRPTVPTFPVTAPRIAIVHSWANTQSEGWYRLAFDQLKIPYDYVSVQVIGRTPDLKARWDVLILAPGIGTPDQLVNGLPGTAPIPWKRTPLTPNLGAVDSSDDIRPGMGLEGVQHLKRFLERGGNLIAIGSSVQFPIQYGLTRWVYVSEPRRARVIGAVLQAEVVEPRSPLTFGYDSTFAVYLSRGPLLSVGLTPQGAVLFGGLEPEVSAKPSGRGSARDPDVPQGRPYVEPPQPPELPPWAEGFEPEDPQVKVLLQGRIPPPAERPRVILRFPKQADRILISGLLDGASELAGRPILVDVPVGRGRVLLYAFNPVWRHETWGTFGLLFQAFLYHHRLDLGWPPTASP